MAQGAIAQKAAGTGAWLGEKAGQTLRATARLSRKQPLGAIGLALCLVMVFFGIFAPLVDRYSPTQADGYAVTQPPSARHWFGTDENGRDMYSRVVHGARISLLVAFSSVFLGTTVGYLVGLFSGYMGAKVDIMLQRLVDAMLAFPTFLLALAFVAVFSAGLDKVIFAIALTTAPRAARVARGVALSIKENVYIDAARVVGLSNTRILLRHVLPNSLAPYLILGSIGLGAAILTEASLSYLGLGVPPPHASWGRMLSGYAQTQMLLAPWMAIVPGIAIMLLVLGFNLFGDALRDVWDPKLRGR